MPLAFLGAQGLERLHAMDLLPAIAALR